MDSAYHSLNRTILYQLSRPLARLTGEEGLATIMKYCARIEGAHFACLNVSEETWVECTKLRLECVLTCRFYTVQSYSEKLDIRNVP